MTDIAQLGIAVDSRQVKDATKDLDKFSEAGQDAEKSTDGLSKTTSDKLRPAMIAAGAAVGAAGLAIIAATKSAIDAADAINTLTVKTGISANILTGYQHAAALSNVSNEALSSGLKLLAKQMQDNNSAFEDYGITTRDANGKLLETNVVLEKIADKLQSMPDGAEKSALAMELMGRAGDDLIPLLNDGSAGLEKFRLEAEMMGTAISDDFAQQAAQFSDNLDTIGLMAKAAANSIAGFMLPALNGLADLILVTNQERAKAFKIELANLTEEGVIRTEWQRDRIAFLNEEIAKLDQVAAAEKRRIAGVVGTDTMATMRGVGDTSTKPPAEGRAPRSGGATERISAGTVFSNSIDDISFVIRQNEIREEMLQAQYDADTAELDQISSQFSKIKEEEEGFRAWQRELRDASNAENLAKEEEFFQSRLDFSKKATSEQMAFTAGALAQGLAYSAQHNRKAFEAQKIFALSEAAINGANGAITTWNSYPYPWNIPMTAAHVAGTAGLISSINSKTFGGGGGGGASMPSVGASAPAGVLPQVSTQPVITGGSQGTTIAPIARQVNLSITGDSFSYNDIANKLIPMINEAVGNGIELRVTA